MANHVEYHKFFLRSDAKLAKKNVFTLYKKNVTIMCDRVGRKSYKCYKKKIMWNNDQMFAYKYVQC